MYLHIIRKRDPYNGSVGWTHALAEYGSTLYKLNQSSLMKYSTYVSDIIERWMIKWIFIRYI